MKKFGKVMAAAVVYTLWASIAAFAGEWKTDANGWWYAKDDGSYIASDWLNDNGKFYYFNAEGYMLSDVWVGNYYVGADGAMLTNATTPDGYYVGADGMWVEGGQAEVQDNQYLDAYAAFLRSYKIPKGKSSEKPRFHLLYIDGDTIPELVIADGSSHANGADLYVYYQGAVQKIDTFGSNGGFSYVHGANMFCSGYSGSGMETVTYYTLQNNHCIPLIRFDGYDSNYDYIYDECSINDIPVTEAIYQSQCAIWDSMFTPISFAGYSYGHTLNETNIKKMLENIQNVMPKDNR